MMYSTIILDFDGVILESVSIKTEAFRKLFSFAPDHIEEIIQYHKENGGMSRFEKFKYIYTNILKENLTHEQFMNLSKQFSSIVFEGVCNAPFVPGAQEFLHKTYQKIPLFIISATPENELQDIISRRRLNTFFKGVYGAPTKKTRHIQTILSETKKKREDTVFIGDSLNDLIAAKDTGIHFIGRISPGEKDLFTGNPRVVDTINTLFDLDKIISREMRE